MAYNVPPRRGIEEQIELLLNNVDLGLPKVTSGWLEFRAKPRQLALGANLIGIRLKQPRASTETPLVIEMLEIDVRRG